MNEFDIDNAARRFAAHPALGPAVQTIANLRDCANRNSDGWAYWPKPCRSAARLIELIEGDGTNDYRDNVAPKVTAEDVRKAYRPIKAFLTRSGLTDQCTIIDPR